MIGSIGGIYYKSGADEQFYDITASISTKDIRDLLKNVDKHSIHCRRWGGHGRGFW